MESPLIFSNSGFVEDGVVCFKYKGKSSNQIQHGWKKIGNTAVITKVEANEVVHINWTNAKEFYGSILQDADQVREKDLEEKCGNFPIGILDNTGKCKVRDILSLTDKGHLLLSEPVNENENIEFLHGCQKSLLKASEKSLVDGLKSMKTPKDVFVFNCFGRYTYNSEYFQSELNLLHNICQLYNVKNEGILSLGEISSNENNILEYHNKSVGTLIR